MSKEESYTLEYLSLRSAVMRHLEALEKDVANDNYKIPGKVFAEVAHALTNAMLPEPKPLGSSKEEDFF